MKNSAVTASKEQQQHRTVFVILMSGRCGSSLLMSYLNQVPDIICYPEILFGLNKNEQNLTLEALLAGTEKDLISDQRAIGYNDSPPSQKDQGKVVAAGLKTKYGDITDFSGFVELVNTHRIKILYMTRENVLNAALSRLRAQKLFELYGDFNMTHASQNLGPMYVDIVEFSDLLAQEQNYYDSLNDIIMQFNFPVPGMTYEQLVNKPSVRLNRVLELLGSNYRVAQEHFGLNAGLWIKHAESNMTIAPLAQKVIKMTSNRIGTEISNYSEFAEYFRKTKYSRFLYTPNKS